MEHWKKLGQEIAYNGWRKIIRKRFELPDGAHADYDVLGAGHYVTVAALTRDQQFVLVRQFRPGPERVLISFPEGAIDRGESPQDAARRELLEETGFAAENITLLKVFSSSYTTQLQYCLLATGCDPIAEPETDHDEFLEVMTLPIADLRRLMCNVDDGTFNNVGCAYLALEYLGRLTLKA